MKSNQFPATVPSAPDKASKARVPQWLKWAYTAFMLVLVPVYWAN